MAARRLAGRMTEAGSGSNPFVSQAGMPGEEAMHGALWPKVVETAANDPR